MTQATKANGFTVHQFPTLTNPKALHTVAELRVELDRANQLLLDLAARSAEAKAAIASMAEQLTPVVGAYLSGSAADTHAAVGQLLARHVVVTGNGQQPGGVH